MSYITPSNVHGTDVAGPLHMLSGKPWPSSLGLSPSPSTFKTQMRSRYSRCPSSVTSSVLPPPGTSGVPGGQCSSMKYHSFEGGNQDFFIFGVSPPPAPSIVQKPY